MSIDSSSHPNSTLPPHPQSNSSLLSFYGGCAHHIPSLVLYSVYTFINIFLLLPLYLSVIYTGYQRERRQKTASRHSDVLTYHIVVVEIFGVLGSFLFYVGIHVNSQTLSVLGVLVTSVIFPGQNLFHCLTCLERYLAVLHPIVYRRLQETSGVRVRDVSVGCVWLLCCGWVGLTQVYMPMVPVTPLLCLFSLSIVFISFCSLSVLFALRHPGPKDVGGDKERVAQTKWRAFCIMMSITCVLLLRFVGILGTFGLYYLVAIPPVILCTLMDLGLLLTIPSSLILPLLFLHKTGKLTKSGHRNT